MELGANIEVGPDVPTGLERDLGSVPEILTGDCLVRYGLRYGAVWGNIWEMRIRKPVTGINLGI